ncbi:glycosyltransferase family 39 protein [uncultured Maritalea sp.]|uniref:ArnT family glycosyltransferase n=1 Tax=uncultured Maritalea sp. TaxID=757249 RepID=UPI0026059E1B|nr:glycosyltransferase family 39 protein [uncultured Maritalea sp.]
MNTARHVKQNSNVLLLKSPFWIAAGIGIAILVSLRMWFWTSGTILPDEAYYWMWSQHPAISYYDHPPLNAWSLWLSSKLFGWNIFGLRIVPVLTFFADLWVLWLITKLISDQPISDFIVTAILFLSTPIFLTMSMLALPDHLLILCLLLSLYFFIKFFNAHETFRRWSPLYLACIFLGFATLAKYNAVLLGVGVFAFALYNQQTRSIFKHWQSYAAFALFLLVLSPEIYWNISTKASSVTFILQDRHAGLPTDNNLDGVKGFAGGMIAFLSPFLIWPLIKTLFKSSERNNNHLPLGRAIFWASTLVFLGLSFTTDIMFHWNLVAYVGILPFLGLFFRANWLLLAHMLSGIIVAGLIAYNFSILPLRTYFSSADYFSARAFGWDETAQITEQLRDEFNVDFVAGTHYTVSSPLGFAMQDADVTDLGPQRSQYQFWFEPAEHIGQNALVVTDHANALPIELEQRFNSVEQIDVLEIKRSGYLVEKRHFYLASGFKG